MSKKDEKEKDLLTELPKGEDSPNPDVAEEAADAETTDAETTDTEDDEHISEDEVDESKLISINVNALILKRAKEKEGRMWVHDKAKIQEVHFFEHNERMRVAITIDRFYKGPKKDRETEEWGLGNVNVIYTFPSLLRRALLKAEGNIKRVARNAMNDEDLLNMFLIDCPILFAVEAIDEDEVYVNPITGVESDHASGYETRYTHLLGIKQDKESKEYVADYIKTKMEKHA